MIQTMSSAIMSKKARPSARERPSNTSAMMRLLSAALIVLASLVRLRFSRSFDSGGGHVDLAAFVVEALAHLVHGLLRFALADGGFRLLRLREVPHFLRNLHRAEFGTAHRAEMGGFGGFGGEGLVV